MCRHYLVPDTGEDGTTDEADTPGESDKAGTPGYPRYGKDGTASAYERRDDRNLPQTGDATSTFVKLGILFTMLATALLGLDSRRRKEK